VIAVLLTTAEAAGIMLGVLALAVVIVAVAGWIAWRI
jgi:hypothetical protein